MGPGMTLHTKINSELFYILIWEQYRVTVTLFVCVKGETWQWKGILKEQLAPSYNSVTIMTQEYQVYMYTIATTLVCGCVISFIYHTQSAESNT